VEVIATWCATRLSIVVFTGTEVMFRSTISMRVTPCGGQLSGCLPGWNPVSNQQAVLQVVNTDLRCLAEPDRAQVAGYFDAVQMGRIHRRLQLRAVIFV
jgi:hypothetical protein